MELVDMLQIQELYKIMINKAKMFQGMEVTFLTNSDCNLACKYCYEVNKKKQILDLDTAKKFIDHILIQDPLGVLDDSSQKVLKRGIILDFVGGDALMHPELLDEILTYFIHQATLKKHSYAKRWRISISTNGTLFNNIKVRNFIKKYNRNLSIGISFDGTPELHNLNRVFLDGKGSFESIMENWEWFKQIRGKDALVTKATLSKESIPYIYDSLRFLHEKLGLIEISQNFVFEDMQLTQKDLLLLDQQLEKCVDYVFEHREDLYWSMIDRYQFAEAKSYSDQLKTEETLVACGSGLMPALSIEGYIFPCFRFLPISMNSNRDIYYAGNVKEGIDKEKFAFIRSLTKDKISPDKCKECDIESACKWCIAGCYSETGKFERQTYICECIKLQCKWAKIYWEKYDATLQNNKEANDDSRI